MTQCEVCGGETFEETEQGALECASCGLLSQNFVREAADPHMVGVAMHNRRASGMPRRRGKAVKAEQTPPTEEVDHEVLFGRALTATVSRITGLLIAKFGCKPALENVMRRITRAFVYPPGDPPPLQLHVKTPLTALALCQWGMLFTREKLLPRDLVVLTVSDELPYLAPNKTILLAILDDAMVCDEKNRTDLIKLFTPPRLPTARAIYGRMRTVGAMAPRFCMPLEQVSGESLRGDARYFSELTSGIPVGDAEHTLQRFIHELALPEQYLYETKKMRFARKAAVAAHYSPCGYHLPRFFTLDLSLKCLAPSHMCTEFELAVDTINAVRVALASLPETDAAIEIESLHSALKNSTATIYPERFSDLPFETSRSLQGRGLQQYIRSVSKRLPDSKPIPCNFAKKSNPGREHPSLRLLNPCSPPNMYENFIYDLITRVLNYLGMTRNFERTYFCRFASTCLEGISSFIKFRQDPPETEWARNI